MEKIKIKEDENLAVVNIDTSMYSIDAIYGAAYNFLDKVYVLLDGDPKKTVQVSLKGKEKMSKKEIEDMAHSFFNELVSLEVRTKISNKNRLIREYIISAALVGASPNIRKKLEEESGAVAKESEDGGLDDDPLGIAVAWEAKYNQIEGDEQNKGKEKEKKKTKNKKNE